MIRSGAVARPYIVAISVIAVLFMAPSVLAQGTAQPAITSPEDGQVVQGQIAVEGSTDVANFSAAELAFGYASDPTHTWFTIQTASLPASKETLATWDTTLITDGDYVLRLRVTLLDGSFQDATVTVLVRNYTSVPTPTPAVTPTGTAALEIPTAIILSASETPTQPVVAPLPTPSPLPPNPAGVTIGEIYGRFWRGALVVGILVLIFGAMIRFRR